MREGPRQPRNLEREDEGALAFLGERIESWQTLRNASDPIASVLAAKETILGHIKALRENEVATEEEVATLSADFIDLTETSENDFATLCDAKIEYYTDQRRQYIKAIG